MTSEHSHSEQSRTQAETPQPTAETEQQTPEAHTLPDWDGAKADAMQPFLSETTATSLDTEKQTVATLSSPETLTALIAKRTRNAQSSLEGAHNAARYVSEARRADAEAEIAQAQAKLDQVPETAKMEVNENIKAATAKYEAHLREATTIPAEVYDANPTRAASPEQLAADVQDFLPIARKRSGARQFVTHVDSLEAKLVTGKDWRPDVWQDNATFSDLLDAVMPTRVAIRNEGIRGGSTNLERLSDYERHNSTAVQALEDYVPVAQRALKDIAEQEKTGKQAVLYAKPEIPIYQAPRHKPSPPNWNEFSDEEKKTWSIAEAQERQAHHQAHLALVAELSAEGDKMVADYIEAHHQRRREVLGELKSRIEPVLQEFQEDAEAFKANLKTSPAPSAT